MWHMERWDWPSQVPINVTADRNNVNKVSCSRKRYKSRNWTSITRPMLQPLGYNYMLTNTHTPHAHTTYIHTHVHTCIPTCMHTLTHAHYSTLHNTLTMSNNNTRCRADRIYSQSAVLTIWHVKVEGTGGLCNYTAYMSGNMLTKTILEQAYFYEKNSEGSVKTDVMYKVPRQCGCFDSLF